MAPQFLSWLNLPSGQRWLDVGCRTGALCAAILDHSSPALVVGIEASDGFRGRARQNLARRAVLYRGSATAIPLAAVSVDVLVSALVLNFIPDLHGGMAEMLRVTVIGGTIAAYVWDYAGKMELIRLFWDVAVSLDSDAAKLDEGVRFPLCKPEPLNGLLTSAGLVDVETTPIDIQTRFDSFDDYWSPFLGGQEPAPAYVTLLDASARERLRDRLRPRLPIASDGSITLTARAWAVRGTVAK